MSLTLLLPYKILARFVPDCDHDKLYTQALFRTFIYLLPSRKSYYLLSFCTINHFVRVAVTFSFFFFPNGGHHIWNETHHCFSPWTGLSLFIFSSSSCSLSVRGPRGRSIALSGSQDPTCPSGLSQPASQPASLPFSLDSVEVNISRGGCMEKHFPFSRCSQMSILVFHTARHFPALSNHSASRRFQPMQKINDIIAT